MNSDRTFKHYGVKESTELTSAAESYIEEIVINGFTVVPDVANAVELAEARRRVDQIYETQAAEAGGANRLQQINDELVVRCLLAYDEVFLGWATNPKVLEVVQGLLGDYFILNQQNGIINLPGRENYQTSWHRDLMYQHFVASRPLAVSALFCLDDFTVATGGTYVLPATHRQEKFPSREFVQRHELPLSAPAGSALVFDSMIFHRGGHNVSPHTRRGLNHMYALPFIKQQIALPRMLNGKYSEDEFLRRFLGYESEPSDSVTEWRATRFARLEGK